MALVHVISLCLVIPLQICMESTCEDMDRKLPVLVARALVASTTNENATANNTLKENVRFAERHVVDAVNQAWEINVSIRVNVEKSDDNHADGAPKKTKKMIMKFVSLIVRFGKIIEKTVP